MSTLRVLHKTFSEWRKDKASRMAAALSYYMVFSLPPLLLIVIAIGSQFFDEKITQQEVFFQLSLIVGDGNADFIRTVIQDVSASGQNSIATIVGIVTLLLAASGVMAALQDSFNTIWGLQMKPGHTLKLVFLKRFLSFGMILVIGFLLLVSLIATTMFAAFTDIIVQYYPDVGPYIPIGNALISFFMSVALFAMLFQFLPDVRVPWRDIWMGALLTAVLFLFGRMILTRYFASTDVASLYGVAGSMILLLLWIYYSAQILFFGMEFTKVVAMEHEGTYAPRSYAQFTTEMKTKVRSKPTMMQKIGMTFGVLKFEWRAYRWFKKRRKRD